MKSVEFDANKASWDSWKRPYVRHSEHFIQFDTGEMCMTATWLYDTARRRYGNVGISMCHSSEIGNFTGGLTTISTPEGEKVAKTHIVYAPNGKTAQQLLAVDHKRREIYNVRKLHAGGYQSEGCIRIPNLPRDIADKCSLYWANTTDKPACQPIRRVRPRKLTPEQRERSQEAKILCTSISVLKELEKGKYSHASDWLFDTGAEALLTGAQPVIDIVSNMADNDILHVHKEGVPSRVTDYVPYLKF